MRAVEFKGLKPNQVIEKIYPICQSEQKRTGILASVTMGQFILESGWGKSELCQKANNGFGMKTNLSGNTWKGSSWDGKSHYEIVTAEYKNGKDKYYIKAKFRKYDSIEQSIADHSAYLLGAMNGNKKRYDGISECTDYKKALKIICSGGYATFDGYGKDVIKIIEQYKLTQYDIKQEKSKAMKINVHAGHTSQNGKACGACGIVKESIEDRKIKEEVIRILESRGHTVYDCTAEGDSARDNLQRIVEKCNAHLVDLDVSIHLNCYNGAGHGTETLIYSSKSKAKKQAKKITKNIAKLGYTNRGVKVRSDLYVLHRTNAPALLVETFFCDNKGDCSLYKKVGAKGIAKAIADGITTKTIKQKIKDKVTKKNSIGKDNRVIAAEVINGKWGNGEDRKKRLKEAGYDYKAIQKIVNELLKA